MLEPSSYHRLWNSSRPARSPKARSSAAPTGATRLAAIADVVDDPAQELGGRHRRQLLARTQPHADGAGLFVAPAGDHHVGHLLRLRFSDLALHLLVAVVQH